MSSVVKSTDSSTPRVVDDRLQGAMLNAPNTEYV